MWFWAPPWSLWSILHVCHPMLIVPFWKRCIQLSLLSNLYWTLSLSNISLCWLWVLLGQHCLTWKSVLLTYFPCCLWRLLWPGAYFWSLVFKGVPRSQTFVTDSFVNCMSLPDWLSFGIGLNVLYTWSRKPIVDILTKISYSFRIWILYYYCVMFVYNNIWRRAFFLVICTALFQQWYFLLKQKFLGGSPLEYVP